MRLHRQFGVRADAHSESAVTPLPVDGYATESCENGVLRRFLGCENEKITLFAVVNFAIDIAGRFNNNAHIGILCLGR